MFVAPKPKAIDKSGGAFSSNKVNKPDGKPQVVDPSTTLGTGPGGSLPIEGDTISGALLKTVMGAIANPITTTAGRDKLATVDPYKKQINTPQSLLVSILSTSFGTPGAILGGIVENEGLRKMSSELIRTGKVSSATSKEYLKGFSNNLLTGVTDTIAGPFLKQVQDSIGLTGIDPKQLASSVLGVDGAPRIEDVLAQNPNIAMVIKGKEYFANSDFSSANGIFKVLDNLTSPNSNLSTLLDLNTEFAIMNVVTKSLMAFEAPDLFEKAAKHFRDDDESVTSDRGYNREDLYYADNLDNAIDESSLVFLECALKNTTPDKLLNKNRNFVKDFLANFKLRFDEDPSKEVGLRLIDIMTKIDPLWDKTQLIPGQGDWVSDLGAFHGISNDANRVITLSGKYDVEMVIGNYYPPQPLVAYMKAVYPYALL